MPKWRECRLGDVIELIGGGTPKTSVSEYWDGDIPWLSVVDFNTGNKFVYTTEKSITKTGLENSSTRILNPGDIIVSARGTVGAMAVLKKPMAFNQSCYGVRNVEGGSDKGYLYYLLKDSVCGLQQIAHGGVFDTITRETFDSIDVSLPPLPEQCAIAAVLSSLDDKIDLLLRQNKTLESLASILWRKMFIEDVNPKWTTGVLGDMVELCYGKALRDGERISGRYPVVGSSGVVGKHNDFYVKGPGVVIGRKGTLGLVNYIAEDFWPIDTTFFVKTKSKSEKLYFEYFLLKEFAFEDMNSDSAVPGLNRSIAEAMEVMVPEQRDISIFNETCAPMFEKRLRNESQLQKLISIRDTLLPKLISGEIKA